MPTFHLVAKVHHSVAIFDDATLLRLIISRLFRFAEVGGAVIAYCIMPNHVHIMARVPDEAALALAMASVLSLTARVQNQNWEQRGVVFERPFRRYEVLDESYRRHLPFYIHANVRPRFEHISQLFAGHTSSHAAWHSGGPDWLDVEFGLRPFGGLSGYRGYCMEMAGKPRLPPVRPELDAFTEHAVLRLARTRHMHPDTLLAGHRGGTPERIELAKQLRDLGLTINDVATVLSAGRSSVTRWLKPSP